LFDLSAWQVTFTPTSPMSHSLMLGIAWAAAAALVAAVVVRRSPVLAGALAAIALTPRLHVYSVGILAIPARQGAPT
jgi:hypothetical protein